MMRGAATTGVALVLLATPMAADAQPVTRVRPATGAPYADALPVESDVGLPVAAGVRLPSVFLSEGYRVRDEAVWNLPPAGPGLTWVRYFDDAALVDDAGVVREVRRSIGWEQASGPAIIPTLPAASPVEQIATNVPPSVAPQPNEARCVDPRPVDRTGTTVAGAAGGAVLGAVAGGLIAGSGDGALIGAGLGGVAGGLAGSQLGREGGATRPCPPLDDRTFGYPTGRPVSASHDLSTQAYGGRRIIGYVPGPVTTTTITFDDGTTTTTTTGDAQGETIVDDGTGLD